MREVKLRQRVAERSQISRPVFLPTPVVPRGNYRREVVKDTLLRTLKLFGKYLKVSKAV